MVLNLSSNSWDKNISDNYMGSGDYLTCSSNIVVNKDLSATVTLELCKVCYKSMLTVTSDPREWIENVTHNRARKAGDIIYKHEIDRHLENGTTPPNPTKGNLILEYEIPVVVEPSTDSVYDDPVATELQAEKAKVAKLELLIEGINDRMTEHERQTGFRM
jgi:hypothetical protein